MDKSQLSRDILSSIIAYMKYAKFVPQLKRREMWEETVERNKYMHLKKYPMLAEEIDKVYEYVLQKKVLPSMRSMQFAGKAIEINNSRIYNCSAVAIDDPAAFNEIMFLLLSGTGAGYSVQKHHVKKLPSIRTPIYPKNAQERKKRYLVEDSIMGWANAVKVLMESYFEGTKAIDFDFRDIRPKGSLLKTAGGKAPGPQPLKDALHNITKVMDRALEERGENTKLKPIEVHDIVCFIAEAVLAGGIRRSACISLFSLDDDEMLAAKSGAWWEQNPQRSRANNSVMLIRHKVKKEDFTRIWEYAKASGAGEPGIVFSNDKEVLTNPCSPAWVKLLTPNGLKPLGELDAGDTIWTETGWATISKKWSTGVKKVKRYRTTSGVFYGTENHRVVSFGEKVEVRDAVAIDSLTGPVCSVLEPFDLQSVVDGLIVGDGVCSKNKLHEITLCIGSKDNEYFTSEISDFILSVTDCTKTHSYNLARMKTTITHEDLPYTYERYIPERFLQASPNILRSFLRGLYTANGSLCGERVTYKTASSKMAEDVQMALSSLGILSYVTTNKPSAIKWKNGTYTSRQSYDVNITRDRKKFLDLIGFIHKYKTNKLKEMCDEYTKPQENGQPKRTHPKTTFDIVEVSDISEEEVFDITVDNEPHTYWTGGLNVSNCAEISLKSCSFCNLTEVNVSGITSQEELNERVRIGAFLGTLQAGYTDLHYLRDIWRENTEKEALLGVSMTGIAGCDVYNLNFDEAAKIAVEENKRIAKIIGVNPAYRVTTVKPSGTTSLICGSSSGVHAWHSKYYIRRVRVGKEEAIYKYLAKHNPELVEDEFFNPNDQAVISIPVKAPEGAITRTESEIDLLNRVKYLHEHWIKPGHRKGSN